MCVFEGGVEGGGWGVGGCKRGKVHESVRPTGALPRPCPGVRGGFVGGVRGRGRGRSRPRGLTARRLGSNYLKLTPANRRPAGPARAACVVVCRGTGGWVGGWVGGGGVTTRCPAAPSCPRRWSETRAAAAGSAPARRPRHPSAPFIRAIHPSHSSESLNRATHPSHSSEPPIRATPPGHPSGPPGPPIARSRARAGGPTVSHPSPMLKRASFALFSSSTASHAPSPTRRPC